MSCSEALIHCNARISRLFHPRKPGKTRRPTEFAPRITSGLSRKWVGIWVRADSGSSRNEPLKQRRGFFLLCMIFRSVKLSPRSIVLYLPSTTESSYLAQQVGRHKQRRDKFYALLSIELLFVAIAIRLIIADSLFALLFNTLVNAPCSLLIPLAR